MGDKIIVRYASEQYIDEKTNILDKKISDHAHDGVYCTQKEVDTKIQTYIEEAILGGEW